jgi:hypothetical protein
MWFKRKTRNRRAGNIHVLDVKLRSSQVRNARFKFGAVAIGSVLGVVFGIYLLWRGGEWMLNQLAYENPSFTIQSVDVQTDGVVSKDQMRRWTGVKPGQNLLALDLAVVKRNLEMVSVVKSVSIERVLPSTLQIRISEREPIAQINVPRPKPQGGLEVVVFHFDAEGYVLQPLDPRQRVTPLNQVETPLPVIMGLGASDMQPGRRIETPQVQAALRLVGEFECSPLAGVTDIKRIDVGYPEVLMVTTMQGSEVTFGLQNLDWQLRRWHHLHETGRLMNKIIASLDLAVTNNTPLTWLEVNNTPFSSPKPNRPQRTRRRNV